MSAVANGGTFFYIKKTTWIPNTVAEIWFFFFHSSPRYDVFYQYAFAHVLNLDSFVYRMSLSKCISVLKKLNLKHTFHVSKTSMFVLPHVALPVEPRRRQLEGQWKTFIYYFLFIIFEWTHGIKIHSLEIYQKNYNKISLL